MNLVVICTPGNTGSSLLTAAFAAHGFAAGANKGHSGKYATHENKTVKEAAKRYIRENGGSPWAIGGNMTVKDDWRKVFSNALRREGLSNENNVVIKGYAYLWLKDQMPPAHWVLAWRNQQRTVESMHERLWKKYRAEKSVITERVAEYFAVAEKLCDYVVDMDAFVKGDAQRIPDIMDKCGIVYDRDRMINIVRRDLWRGDR